MKVSFKLNRANTSLGEQIFIVGSLTSIGLWNPQAALPLETNERLHPNWVSPATQLIVSPQESPKFEYKYLNCLVDTSSTKKRISWEFGENRVVNLTKFLESYKSDKKLELVVEDPGFNEKNSNFPRVFTFRNRKFDGCYQVK